MRRSIISGGPIPESWEEFQLLALEGPPTLFLICSDCRKPFSPANIHTSAGWAETQISSMCEDCYDALFADEEDSP